MTIQFDYNSPVIITYLFLSLGACFLNYITKGWTNAHFFSSYPSSPLNPLTYVRLITHSIGHQNWEHLVGNFLYILLIGPMIEEKYGSTNLLAMLIVTSVVIGIFNSIIDNYVICGASGNVYMLIVLSSFSNISEGKVPLTLVLILLFYITTELKNEFFGKEKGVYHWGHLMGAVCGLVFGFVFFKNPEIVTNTINTITNLIP